MIKISASNYTIFRAKHVDAIKFGDTKWTDANITSTGTALDTSFAQNNGTILLDAVGDKDANSPVNSEAFAKDLTFSGNERSVETEDLLGADTNGTQNQEFSTSATSLVTCELTMVYRNNVPTSIFNDSTECCLLVFDNSESSGTGVLNIACNDITMTHVGSLAMSPDGMMEQKLKFSFLGGTTGAAVSVTQADPSETWERITGGDYSEEVRLT